ncbi:MAG: arylamine N-acetyltransferase, partial [Parvularculaceae bacterium]|nr:arylamine N-acetyltransferase [Parvularculaceae bacterium]
IEPVALREGSFRVGHFACALERIGDGWWRYRNDPQGSAPSFDFNEAVTDEALLETQSRFLQTNPASPFVQNLVVQRWDPGGHMSLRGRVLQRSDENGRSRDLIEDADGLVRALRNHFDLDAPEAARLWPQILARHATVFSDAPFTSH